MLVFGDNSRDRLNGDFVSFFVRAFQQIIVVENKKGLPIKKEARPTCTTSTAIRRFHVFFEHDTSSSCVDYERGA